MNKNFWTEEQEILDYSLYIKEKGRNRSQIEDTIFNLNKLKPEIQQLNIELIAWDRTDLEKKKLLWLTSKYKSQLLRQLIFQLDSNKDYKFEYIYNWQLEKMTFIFYKNNKTVHISHVPVRSLLYISNNITLSKDIISRISDNKIRNFLYLQLKNKLWNEI